MTKFQPFRIDDQYIALRHIKTGGFGVVYGGWDEQLALPVALKQLRPDLLDHDEQLQLFRAEARVVARLTHPAICRMYTLHQAQGSLYMVMEYIPGCDLYHLRKSATEQSQTLQNTVALHVILQTAAALAYAHDSADPLTGQPLRLVHRDLAPSNIMVSQSGAVKVVDFGIARFQGLPRPETEHQLIRGRPRYMAPEQIMSPKDLDHRSDIFSLAIILLELLTGDSVYGPTKSEYDLMDRVKRGDFNLQDFLDRHDVPIDLDPIITRALKWRKEDRPSSMREFVVGLQPYLKAIHYSESSALTELRRLMELLAPANKIEALYREFVDSETGSRPVAPPPKPVFVPPSPDMTETSPPLPLHPPDDHIDVPPPVVVPIDDGVSSHPSPIVKSSGSRRYLLWGTVVAAIAIVAWLTVKRPGDDSLNGEPFTPDTAALIADSPADSADIPVVPQVVDPEPIDSLSVSPITGPDTGMRPPVPRVPPGPSPVPPKIRPSFSEALSNLEGQRTFKDFTRWFSDYRNDSVIVIEQPSNSNEFWALFDSTDQLICIARREGNKYKRLDTNEEVSVRSARRSAAFSKP